MRGLFSACSVILKKKNKKKTAELVQWKVVSGECWGESRTPLLFISRDSCCLFPGVNPGGWETTPLGDAISPAGSKLPPFLWEDTVIALTQWTWVWANSRRWWRTGKPDVLQSLGSERLGHDLATEQQQLLLLQGSWPQISHNNYSFYSLCLTDITLMYRFPQL